MYCIFELSGQFSKAQCTILAHAWTSEGGCASIYAGEDRNIDKLISKKV